MKILITGISGQIGSYLAEEYLNQGHVVYGMLRRTSSSNLWRLSKIKYHNRLVLFEGDVTDFSSVFSSISKYQPDKIANLAGQSHVHTSFSQPHYTTNVVYNGVLNILESMKILHSSARFATANSSEQFGTSFNRAFDDNYQDETTLMKPQSPYAVAKLAAYHLCDIYRTYGLWIIRPILFNSESYRRGENFVTRKITKWVGEFVRWAILEGIYTKSLDLSYLTFNDTYIESKLSTHTFPKLRLGNLEAQRDWTHAQDTAKGILLALEHTTPDDFVFSSGQTKSIKEFLDIIFSLVNLDWHPFVLIDQALCRPNEVPFLLGRSTKAHTELGWEPKISFSDLCREMIDYDISS